MIRRISLTAALTIAVLAVAGCSKPANDQDSLLQEAREAGDDLSATEAPQGPHLTALPPEAPTREPDPATLAGTYQGQIPCQGCDSQDATLTLEADGNFNIHRPGSNPGTNGYWQTEEGGSRIRLDPVHKEEGSQLWAISGSGVLEQLDSDGTPLARDVKPDKLTRKP